MLLPRLCALSDEDPPVGTGSGGQVQEVVGRCRKWWSGAGRDSQNQEVVVRTQEVSVRNRKWRSGLRKWRSGTGSGDQGKGSDCQQQEVAVRNRKWWSGLRKCRQEQDMVVWLSETGSGCQEQESFWCAYRVSGNGPITAEEACDWSLCCWQVVSGWKTLGSSSSSAKPHDNCVPGRKPISEGLVKVPSCFRANHTWMDDGQTEAADWLRGSAGPTSLPVEDSLLPRRPTVRQQEVLPADAVQVSHDL